MEKNVYSFAYPDLQNEKNVNYHNENENIVNNEQLIYDFAVIKFAPQDWILSDSNLDKLERFSKYIQDNDEVKIAAWSDKPFPALPPLKLNDEDKNLALRRGNNIVLKLKELLKSPFKIKIYNMGENANTLGIYFNSESAQLKLALTHKKTSSVKNVNKDLLNKLKLYGEPSTVLLFLIRPEIILPEEQTGIKATDFPYKAIHGP